MPAEAHEQVILGARWKAVLAVAGSIGFVVLGLWLIRVGEMVATVIGGVSVVFFGLCGVVGAGRLVRPARLVLRPESFTIEQPPFRRKTIEWRDVEDFFIWRHQATRIVGFTYAPGVRRSRMSRINQPFGGDGFLPAGLRLAPEKQLALMQDWKARAERS